jgi:hypothetical protein
MVNEYDPCLLFCDFKTSRKAQDPERNNNLFACRQLFQPIGQTYLNSRTHLDTNCDLKQR